MELTIPRQLYAARLDNGPHDGRTIRVRAQAHGGPPDFIYADDDGAYALAGAADHEGALPYWWMPWARAAALRHLLSDGPKVRRSG